MDTGRFRKSKSEQKKPDPSGETTRLAGLPYGPQLSAEDARIVQAGNRSVLLSRLGPQCAEGVPERYKIGDRIGGLYEVLDIHLGSMGVVYATFDHEERLPRALKTLQQRFAGNRTLRDLFAEEASVWVRLEKHPFIVRAYLAEVIDAQPCVITEYIRGPEGMGRDLRAWLGHPKMTVPVAVGMAMQIAQGMQHATRKVPGLVHRDLKPANILVNDRGQALVTDFGLVLAEDACAGTPAYMAPEQWLGGELDQRTDIYAYGCVLYEMFTGHRLFGARGVDEWKAAHLGEMPVSPRVLRGDLPVELEKFPMRCLAKDPAQRPSSWEEVVEECALWFHRLTGQPVVLRFDADELTKDELNSATYSLDQLGKYPEALETCERTLAIDQNNAWAWGEKGFLLCTLGHKEQALAAYDRALVIDPADAVSWRAKGAVLLSLGRKADAVAAYDRALAINPNDIATWQAKGDALRFLRPMEALRAYECVLAINPNDADAWQTKGSLLEMLHRTEDALAAYEQALVVNPNCASAWRNKGSVLWALGRAEEALAAYDRARALKPPREPPAVRIRDRYYAEDALAAYERALIVNPNCASAWRNKGSVLVEQHRLEEALAAYERALAIDPNDDVVWNNKGSLLSWLGRTDEALAAYERALVISPGDADTWNGKAAVLRKLERFEEALAAYDRALAIDPNDDGVWNNKGSTLEQAGRLEEALAAYERALAIDPNGVWNLQCMGLVLESLRRYEEALAAYERALAIDTDDEFSWWRKGCVLEKLGLYEEALAAYDRANAWYNKGGILQRLGREREAVAAYEQVLADEPDEQDAGAWDERGLALQKLGRLEEALVAYDRALAIDPNHPESWSNKGAVLRALKRYEDALTSFGRALAIHPTLESAWTGKGLSLDDMGRIDEALAAFEHSLAVNPNDVDTWKRKASALQRLSRHIEALEAFERTLALDPNDAATWALKGATLFSLARSQEALETFDRALAIKSNVGPYWWGRGSALLKLGRADEALEAFSRALAIDPDHPLPWLQKGVALRDLGRMDEALPAFDRALALDPNDAYAWRNKGFALKALGRLRQASAAFDWALAIDPTDEWTQRNKAETEEQLRRTQPDPSGETSDLHSLGQGDALSGTRSPRVCETERIGEWRERSQGLLDEAAEEARRLQHCYLGVEHLFIALTHAPIFSVFGLDAAQVRDAIRRETGTGKGAAEGFPTLTPRLVAVLRRADQHAGVGSPLSEEQILRALMAEGQSLPLRYLASVGCQAATCLARLDSAADSDFADRTRLAAGPEAALPVSVPTPALDQWGRDLCKLARLRKLADVTGRDSEIQQIVTVLARTQKSNPLLLGEAGVGKTAIVEGLAWRISQGQVPPVLRGKRIVEIDMAGLVAGTTLRGQFEERVNQIISEAANAPDVILFVDELHAVIGAGGADSAAQIFKPPLARGDISCIGSTTQDEYARFIRKDPALERRFSPISIKELTPTATLAVLRAVAPRILGKQASKGQRLKIVPDALKAAVTLTGRYVKDRHQPDKSIDAIDIACARAVVSGRNLVTADDVALVVSEWTGIPAGRLTTDEQHRYARMEATLAERVIGQGAAVSAVSRSIRAAMAGVKQPNRPVGVFLFLGPSGVGKTHLAKELAAFLFDTTDALIRFDMNEYQTKYTVSNLIGAPRGYVDSERSGQFTEALRRRPYSVVLLDEIEKAHPDILNLFLSVFDDGRITDNMGRAVDCSNAVFILTSNMGGETIGFTTTEAADLRNLAAQSMRPELVNRITEIVRFVPLGRQELARILDRILAEKTASFRSTQGITVEIDESAREVILGIRFDPRMGARPLERAVETLIVQPLVDAIFAEQVAPGEVRATAKAGRIVFISETGNDS